jgi:hypothetical protein
MAKVSALLRCYVAQVGGLQPTFQISVTFSRIKYSSLGFLSIEECRNVGNQQPTDAV